MNIEYTIRQSNGWNTDVVSERSAANSAVRTYTITWRNQEWKCCGGQPPIRFDADNPPYFIDGSYAEVKDRTQQCGGCGKHHTAVYTDKED